MLYLFEDYGLDTDRRELYRATSLISVEPKVFDLLVHVIRNRERVVSKDDLVATIWNGRIVSESALTTCINAARTAIGDSGEAQRLIRTLPRKGIRFVGIVREEEGNRVAVAPTVHARETSHPSLALPDKPSIAVLPFENLSGDPAQEYFADGMVEDIITALSRMRWLFVIARNSSFAYKGRAVDVRQVGRELGVRYVLEGSVRKAGNRVRIAGQLIDASTGANMWADRFEGQLEDIFDLQDQVTASVVGAIAPKLEQAEIERAKRKPTENLDAYDHFLRGMACVHRWTREANAEALRHFARAIQLDPDFAAAYGMAARCYAQRKGSGWTVDRPNETAEAGRLARRAATLGRDDAVALSTAGMALAFVVGDLDGGATLIARARVLDPNSASAWQFSGWVQVWLGKPEVAIEHVAHAMRLSPSDPHVFNMQAAAASAHFFAGRCAEASSWAEAAVGQQPNHLIGQCILAASSALCERPTEARNAMILLRQLEPTLSLSNLKDLFPLKRSEDLVRLAEGLRKAGLPE
ncbi:MAG: winged helix-turn-helix domain-containing protein [Dongiaceae bacterium]